MLEKIWMQVVVTEEKEEVVEEGPDPTRGGKRVKACAPIITVRVTLITVRLPMLLEIPT